MRYTEEQVARAKQADLVKVLEKRGFKFEKSGKEYRCLEPDSMTVNVNKWFRHSKGKGGDPIALMKELFDLDFRDAVKELLDGEEPAEDEESGEVDCDIKSESGKASDGANEDEIKDQENPGAVAVGSAEQNPSPAPVLEQVPEVILPERNENNDQVIKYLTEVRKLDPELVGEMIEKKLIYEDKEHHSVIFVGYDWEKRPCYVAWRATSEEKLRGEIAGSTKAFSFHCEASWTEEERDRRSSNLYVFESAIDLLSFMTLYPKYRKDDHYLSLGGVSNQALMQFLSARPDVENIYLCLDDDQAGHDAVARILYELPEQYEVTRLIPERKDWNDVLVDQVKDPDLNLEYKVLELRKTQKISVEVIRMTDVEQVPIIWLWEPYIAQGKVTLIHGNPGQGKTWLAMQLAAACTNGAELFGEKKKDPFNVFYQTAEDGLGDTIKPRLGLCGADMDRVRVIKEDDKPLSFTDPRLEIAIKQNNVGLLILDPLQAYMGANVDMNRANEVRPLFSYLAGVAERTGCAIVLIGHLNKNAGADANFRGLGSVDITASVRSVILVGKVEIDEKNKDSFAGHEDVRVIMQTKSSLAPRTTPVAFTLENGKFEWIGEYEITEQELTMGKAGKSKESKVEQAKKLILQTLTEHKLMFVKDLDQTGKVLKISERTMREARKKMEEDLEYSYDDSKKTVRLKILEA